MNHSNNKPKIDDEFNEIWNLAGQYTYSAESSNNEAWEKFQSGLKEKSQAKPTFTILKNTQSIWRAAAAITLLAIGGWAFWINQQKTAILDAGSVATFNQQVKQITLKDGSTITLNANSSVKYKVTKNSRNIELQGMAHFEVAKNPNAPFVIRSGQNQVTVLGTGFDVRSYAKKPLQVTVNHGKVRVEKLAKNSNTMLESAILTKGMRVTENPAPSTKSEQYFTVESNVNLKSVSWSNGSLDFDNAPLADVIDAVEERYNVQIEVLGNAPAGLRNNNHPSLTAKFTQNQGVDAVCEIIGQALNLTLQVNRK